MHIKYSQILCNFFIIWKNLPGKNSDESSSENSATENKIKILLVIHIQRNNDEQCEFHSILRPFPGFKKRQGAAGGKGTLIFTVTLALNQGTFFKT